MLAVGEYIYIYVHTGYVYMDDVLGQANLEIVVKPRCKMSKRPVTFNKPEDPSFLKQIKASIGYKDGPTVDTKVGTLANAQFLARWPLSHCIN